MLIVATGVLGGLAIFLFGLQTTGESLQKVAGRALRSILRLVTKKPIVGIFAGTFMTVCTQSSSATTVFLVNFVQAGLMKFSQTIAVILGADIGTTFTVQLIAFRISDYALLMVAGGFLLKTVARYEREKFFGQALFGFGLIFLGMFLMKEGVSPLRDSETFSRLLVSFRERPFVALLVSALVTGIIQSSAATIALLLTFVSQGLFGDETVEIVKASLPVIFGANIGTCATAFLASIQAGWDAKRVALAHILIKVVGVAIFFPLIGLFSRFVFYSSELLSGGSVSAGRMLANSHTIFNVINAMILLPFVSTIGRVVRFVMPSVTKKDRESYPSLLESPALALADAKKKVGEMFVYVQKMLSGSFSVLRSGQKRSLEDLKRMDNIVDGLHEKTANFLMRLTQRTLSEEESREEARLLGLSSHLESLADIVTGEYSFVIEKVIDKDLLFSFSGVDEIEKLHRFLVRIFGELHSSFLSDDHSRIRGLVGEQEVFKKLLHDSYVSHIDRMHKGLSESLSTGTAHFHILTSFQNMHSEIIKIAEIELSGEKIR